MVTAEKVDGYGLPIMLMQAKSDLPYYNIESDLWLSRRTLSQVLGVIDL